MSITFTDAGYYIGQIAALAHGDTTTIDTSGCSCLIAVVATWQYSIPADNTFSDSNGNTWHQLACYGTPSSIANISIFYSYDHAGSALSVGAGHYFTVTVPNNGDYFTVLFFGLSGTDTTSAVYEANTDHGNKQSGSHDIQPGSTTPGAVGDLILTAYADGVSSSHASTIDSSFVVQWTKFDGSNVSLDVAYRLAPNTDAVNPTWTNADATTNSACIAVFKAATGGGSSGWTYDIDQHL